MRASEAEFKRAIELNPNYGFARHIHSILLAAVGKDYEAIAEIRQAADVDPLSIPVRNMLGSQLVRVGRCDEAVAEDKKTLELNPNPPHLGMLHDRQAECLSAQGKKKEAFEEKLLAKAAYGASPAEIQAFRKTYAQSGEKGLIRKELQDALADWNQQHWHVDAVTIASRYADLGDMDNAYKWVDTAVEVRSTMLFWVLTSKGPLQSDPRFEQMKKMGYRE